MDQAHLSSPAVARGTLLEHGPNTIVLGLPGTDYQLHLQVKQAIAAHQGQRVSGTIHAHARRVDIVPTGGRYIEPVYGRPRRLQGTILTTDPIANTITVDCAPAQDGPPGAVGCPFVCRLMAEQKAAGLSRGELVSFDIERGAVFEPLPVGGGAQTL